MSEYVTNNEPTDVFSITPALITNAVDRAMTTDTFAENPEIWKPVVGSEGFYEVSSYGRVRSVDRQIPWVSKWGTPSIRRLCGRQLLLTINNNGYPQITIAKCGTKKKREVHRLVGLSFIPNPLNKPMINHVDGIKTNNHHTNLEWSTCQENNFHSIDKLHPEIRRPIIGTNGEIHLHFPSLKHAEAFGFSTGAIADCLNHPDHHLTHKGLIWKDAA